MEIKIPLLIIIKVAIRSIMILLCPVLRKQISKIGYKHWRWRNKDQDNNNDCVYMQV